MSNTVFWASLPNATIADAVGRLPGVSLERDEGEGKCIQVRSLEPRLTNATGVSIRKIGVVAAVWLNSSPLRFHRCFRA